MPLIKWEPFRDPFMEMDKWFSDSFSPRQGFVPAMDVYEKDNNIFVEVPLPGINPSDVKVTAENNILTISGQSSKKSEVEEKNYYRSEVKSGSFYRSIALPAEVAEKETKATFTDGMLKIILPKVGKAGKPHEIKIDVNNKK